MGRLRRSQLSLLLVLGLEGADPDVARKNHCANKPEEGPSMPRLKI